MKQLTEKTEKTEKTENGRKKAAENNPLWISAAEKCMNQERNCKMAPRKKDILSRLFHDNVPVIKFSVSWSLPRSQSSKFSFPVCRIFCKKQTYRVQCIAIGGFCQVLYAKNQISGALIKKIDWHCRMKMLKLSCEFHRSRMPDGKGFYNIDEELRIKFQISDFERMN